MGRLSAYTPKVAERFCQELAETGRIDRAADAIGVTRKTIGDWRIRYPVFAKAMDEARKIATTILEDEAWRRAHDGVIQIVYHKGRAAGEVRTYSDALLGMLLRANDPAKYRERFQASELPVTPPSADDLLEIAKKIAFIMTRAQLLTKDGHADNKPPRCPAISARN